MKQVKQVKQVTKFLPCLIPWLGCWAMLAIKCSIPVQAVLSTTSQRILSNSQILPPLLLFYLSILSNKGGFLYSTFLK